MHPVIRLLLCLGMTAGLLLASRRLNHYFQLESYQFHGYSKTVLRQWKRAVLPGVCMAAVTAVSAIGLSGAVSAGNGALKGLFAALFFLSYLVCGFLIRKSALKTAEKKKFAMTARMKRLYAAQGVLYAALSLLLLGRAAAFAFLPALFLPLLTALGGVLTLPVERAIFYLYFHDAEKKLLENPRLIRIGITGSYGKTSTKFILSEILSQKYNVLATPASFNTPMGVTRIIRERLTPAHQVFIGEMGARHVGEIKELCRLVHPAIGILTAVGPQHLDTFKTIERIEKTKYELIDALPQDGLAVFVDDGGIVEKLYDRTAKPKLLAAKKGADAWAEDVRLSPEGCRFTLCFQDGEQMPCETMLLGEHNIKNILAASLVARHLGLNIEQIARGIRALKPVEHRLQLIKTPNGIGVIDDAFNTNPRSSKEALKVLSSFPGRRIIVTPGMVELGEKEDQYNEELGRAMAKAVDTAVLVGRKHTAPIKAGLLSQGFPEAAIHTVGSLEEAVQIVNGIIRPGDTVMYENDLPDHYSES